MKPWRFPLRSAPWLALLLAAACGSGGDSGDQMPQQPKSLELFAASASQHIALDPGGVLYATVPIGTPPLDGTPQDSELCTFSSAGQPSDKSLSIRGAGGLTFDAAGNLYFTETRGCVMHFCDTSAGRMAPDGTITKIGVFAGTTDGVSSGSGTLAGIAVDAVGSIYVADGLDKVIRKLTRDGTQAELAGSPLQCTEVDGEGSLAGFCFPSGLAIDAVGNLYVADSGGNTIRRVTPGGDVTTVAGVAFVAGSMDGPAASATFNLPTQLALDGQGNLYVADTGNALIRRISASGDVTTFAGTRGLQGFAPGPLPGTLDPPTGLAIHGSDLYFAMPNAIGRIRNIPGA